jgi:hypothetical protein
MKKHDAHVEKGNFIDYIAGVGKLPAKFLRLRLGQKNSGDSRIRTFEQLLSNNMGAHAAESVSSVRLSTFHYMR